MGIVVDLCVVAILALCVFIGYKKGLAWSVFKILSFFLAIIITLIIYKPVTINVIKKTKINETLKNSIIRKVQDKENNESSEKEEKGIMSTINEKIKGSSEESKNRIVEEAATEISNKIVTVGVTLILFLVVRILLLIVAFVLNLITEIPVISQFDTLGGIIYGALQGAIIIFLIFSITTFFNTLEIFKPVNDAIETSFLGSEIKEIIINKVF